MRAVILAAVSTEEQATDEHASIETQIDDKSRRYYEEPPTRPLSGLTECAECGWSMTYTRISTDGKRYLYIRCSNTSRTRSRTLLSRMMTSNPKPKPPGIP